MSDIICTVCGEPWESYHVRHDMPAWKRDLFLKGAGCEACEGQAKSEEHALKCAERAARQQIWEPDDQEGNFHAAIDQLDGKSRPEWKRPEDPTIWACEGCGLQVKQDLDSDFAKDGSDLYLRPGKGYFVPYHVEKANEDLIDTSEGKIPARDRITPQRVEHERRKLDDGSEEITYKEYCYTCMETCDACSEPEFSEDMFPHPNGYHSQAICRGCMEEWPTCPECSETLPHKDDSGQCGSCEYDRRVYLRDQVDEIESAMDEITEKVAQVADFRQRHRMRWALFVLKRWANKIEATI